ncbi:MAG: alpha/beta fold hydrolase [Nocardiopsaceae bacterium]|nr:alpha/beta fold hydrolase [Nocardiopsaceae bacterium]
MTATSTFVLVPGAGHGGWQWGLRLSDATACVVRAVLDRDLAGVTLVAHSWGGYPVTAAAHQLAHRVSKVIFYSALVPSRGVPLADEDPAYARMIRDGIAATPDGTTAITREQAALLIPGAPGSTRDLLFELLEPTPGRYYTDALDLPDLTTLGIDLAYLLSEDDQVLARPGAEFAARLGLTPVMLPGGHDAMLSHPDAIAKAIMHA